MHECLPEVLFIIAQADVRTYTLDASQIATIPAAKGLGQAGCPKGAGHPTMADYYVTALSNLNCIGMSTNRR